MAKLSSASIRLVQKLNRKNKNGEFPIYIVVCFHGRVEKATGISCLEKYWDKKRECIKNSMTNAPVLNKMLNDIKQRVIDRRSNVNNGIEEPIVDVNKVVLYTARHSFASAYLNSEGATVRGAASLLSRSASTISVYIHALQNDRDIADAVSFLND